MMDDVIQKNPLSMRKSKNKKIISNKKSMKPKFSRYKILQKIRDSSNWTCASTFSVFALCVLASIKPAFSSEETTENDKEKSSGININYGANVEYESLNGVYQNGKSPPEGSDGSNGDLYYDTNNSPRTYNSHNSNQKLGNIEDVISFPNINIGENGIYYSAKNNYQDTLHKIDQNAYSDYEVYKNFFLRPQDPIPKSKVKFKLSSRIIQTRYGKLQGIILSMDEYRYFKPLEVFLGVPYATPPVGSNRFSPTRTPSPWDGIRVSNRPGPACPQKLPDLSDENAALETMPKGRLEYLKRLLPFLKNQSEDCLYMNIFAPYQVDEVKRSLPVVVYVHGESFEWNSGNSYDGSVLAGYADIIVVTLNFRLGLFGFLNANPTPSVRARVANYGLMDQIAALHWVQQNVALFGGDASNITLIGHGTGAACINFLMISPTVMPGLFHRAILLSGSALSSWAIVEDPVFYSIKLAKHVNCTIPDDLARDHETIVDCLREIAIEDLLSADITPPNFLTAFGPSVDGVVIKTDFAKEFLTNFIPNDMQSFAPLNDFNPNLNAHIKRSDSAINRRALQNKYDLMFGVVTSEALAKFSAHDIQNGFESERRDRILRTYVRNAYSYHLSEIFYTVVNEYTDWERSHPINMRDSTIDALSDAQYIAPLVQSGDLLSGKPRDNSNRDEEPASSTSKTFFYVFDYQTKDGDYPQRMGSVHGEELPYLFGAPLVDGFGHFPRNYTKSEVALAESFMLYISNFARSGNPNEHFRQESILAASKERNKFRIITWDEYDAVHQKYLEIGMKPKMKNHFRAHQLSVWLRLIPELHKTGMEDVVAKHNMFRNHNDQDLYEGIVRPDPLTKITSHDSATDIFKRYQTGTNNNTLLIDVSLTTIETIVTTCINVIPNKDQGQSQANITSETIANLEAAGYAAYSTALSVTIAIGCSLLILNVLIFAGVYYQRDKIKTKSKKTHSNQFGPKKFDTISTKQSNYQMEAIQNPTIILDVETQNKLSRKNNKVQNDSNIVNLNFKGPITHEDLSLHIGNRVSMNPLQLNSEDHNLTLPHRAFNRNDVNNSSFKSGPNLTNYQQMSRYATLPKNMSQPQSFNNFNNEIIDKHCLPPNGSAVMIDNRSNDSPKSNLGSSHSQRGADPGKPAHHSINMPQAAIDEMRV